MGVLKTYTKADLEAAITVANEQFLRCLMRVRSDIGVEDWGKPSEKVARDAAGKPVDPLAWRGRGSDVGHTFRHVDQTAVLVTQELLNSPKGQSQLAKLDHLNPAGDESGSDINLRIVADVTGAYYGAPQQGAPLQKIKSAACEIMKISESTLWVHSSYPKRFM